MDNIIVKQPTPVAARSKAWVFGRSLAGTAVYYLLPAVTVQMRPGLLRVRLFVAPRLQFSGITVVNQAAEGKPKSSNVQSDPRVPWLDVLLRRCTVGQIKRELTKIKFTDFHIILLRIT